MADTKDFLLEIGTEEMPSAPLINASKQLPKLVVKMLDEAGLSHGAVRVVSSPRRLAAIVEGVACATEAVNEVKRGPKAQIAFDADGNPTKAASGFARKCGIDASELTRKVKETFESTVSGASDAALRSKLESMTPEQRAAYAQKVADMSAAIEADRAKAADEPVAEDVSDASEDAVEPDAAE